MKLTRKQEQQLGEYTRKWIKIGFSTDRANRPEAEKWIVEVYKSAGLKPPLEFVWVESPQRAMSLAEEMGHVVANGVNGSSCVSDFVPNGMDDSLALFDYYLNCLGIKACERMRPQIEAAKHCGWFLPFEKIVIACERPTEFHFDKAGRLHNMRGPAIRFADGFAVYARHGVVQSKSESKGGRIEKQRKEAQR